MDLLDDQLGEDHPDISINQEFAAKYGHRKRREELSKRKSRTARPNQRIGRAKSHVVQDKYSAQAADAGSDEESESSTEYSSEDSDAEFITPQVDAAILKILGRIRKGDTSIYANDRDFFDGERRLRCTGPR